MKKLKWLCLCLMPVMILMMAHSYVMLSTKGQIIDVGKAQVLEADCILILGAGVWDERPSPMLEDRLKTGISLYGNTDRLLMSGDHGRIDYDEVRVMKQFAIDAGIPQDHVFMDYAGFSTYESIYRAKAIFEVERIIIVTQAYHLPRALYIANQMGLEAYGVSADLRSYAGQEKRALRERLARIKDVFYVMIHAEPTYLGEVIPLTGSGSATDDRPFEE